MRGSGRRLFTALVGLAIALSLHGLTGCGNDDDYDDEFEGNMYDFTWGNQVKPGEKVLRANANGEKICIDTYEGKFIWADYAAPWCTPCVKQAPELKKLASEFGDEVIFLTIITSARSTGLADSIPTVKDARSWAGRFGLDPNRVLVADNLWGMVIPTHIMYSPRGQSLYRASGLVPAQTLREILTERKADWERYERTGKKAGWMR